MDEEIKKEFEKVRKEMQNQYEDALRTIEDDVANFKAKMSDDLAMLQGNHERISKHVDATATAVEKLEKNIIEGNKIMLEEFSNLEKRLLAKIEKTKE